VGRAAGKGKDAFEEGENLESSKKRVINLIRDD
jgi:hypothetical protein